MPNQVEESGSIPIAIGSATVIRIPIPGTNGLCIEFSPRGYVPKSGSTSTLFFQDQAGKRHLRLDYGFNKQTQTFNYHWNQSGTNGYFGIQNHSPVGRTGARIYNAAKYFKYAGRTFVVLGIGLDVISVVRSSSPLRKASEVVSAWALAWAGCKVVGAGGAAAGTLASPVGTAVGGVGGCIIGGYIGYRAGAKIGNVVYDWGDAKFHPIPQLAAPK
jgi:hypothetical protein